MYDTLRDVSDHTPLFGGDDSIDSLSLVTLVATLEREVERTLGARVVLADERAMSQRRSPFRTAGSLVDFICERIGNGHGAG